MENFVYAAGITVLTTVLLIVLAFRTGMSRMSKPNVGVLDTYTTTNKKFLVANRIHLNTLENAAVFLPLLWVASVFSMTLVAAAIGVVWLVARVAFAVLYTKDPAKRTPAFVTSFFCHIALVLLSLYGLVLYFL